VIFSHTNRFYRPAPAAHEPWYGAKALAILEEDPQSETWFPKGFADGPDPLWSCAIPILFSQVLLLGVQALRSPLKANCSPFPNLRLAFICPRGLIFSRDCQPFHNNIAFSFATDPNMIKSKERRDLSNQLLFDLF